MRVTFTDLRIVNATRSLRWHKSGLDEWSLADWIIAVGGEVGEALNVLKKLNRDRDGQPGNTKARPQLLSDLGDELADAIIYLDIVMARQKEGALGAYASIPDFDTLRRGTDSWWREAEQEVSVFGIDMLSACGLISNAAQGVGDLRGAADTLLSAVDGLAWCFGIDLNEAVIRKFNATSERYGFPERLVGGSI